MPGILEDDNDKEKISRMNWLHTKREEGKYIIHSCMNKSFKVDPKYAFTTDEI